MEASLLKTTLGELRCCFKVLFLPHFRVSEMVEGSPLGRTVSRKLIAIGHAEFRRLLMEKAAVHGCRVVFVVLARAVVPLPLSCCPR